MFFELRFPTKRILKLIGIEFRIRYSVSCELRNTPFVATLLPRTKKGKEGRKRVGNTNSSSSNEVLPAYYFLNE